MDLKTITVFLALCILFFLMTVWAIVDVAQKDFGTIGKKALWGVIASIPFVGFIIYIIFGFRKGKKSKTPGIL
ncbi:MAG: PLDc N-terminal domain-containing protein [Proteobacteria bacterium]|nr:PLDc N-terminal domain-containing protein [Pseudomonadota bacterium]MBU4462637.1 PLDc N-terminal domain-containing protein [Pseudomonadota bacterium]